MDIHYLLRPVTLAPRDRATLRSVATASLIAASVVALLVAPLAAQRAAVPPVAGRWRVVTPDAALAWYAVLADLRLPGAGAFAFTAGGTVHAGQAALARSLADSRESESLHFVPLYHPSADRAALAAAVRVAAGDGPPAPRATLVVAALRQALPAASRRSQLPAVADALLDVRPEIPAAERVAAWQALLDTLYGPALAPWLVAERLDEGRLIVAPAIGPEGRLFAGTADRTDNLVAVGRFEADASPDAPLLAFAREVCFPVVSRAARAAGLRAEDPESARRASLAAVRCGSALLDRRLPARASAYRRFWLQRRTGSAAAVPVEADAEALRAAFVRAFPPDAPFEDAVARALARIPSSR